MYYEKAQQAADLFKEFLRDTILDADIKQEYLAHKGYVKQNTISSWQDPVSDRHLPAFQLMLQDEKVVVPLCKMFLKRFNMSVSVNEYGLKIDGNMDDNLLNIDVFQAEIIKARETDPKKVMDWCEKIITEVATIKKEAEIRLK